MFEASARWAGTDERDMLENLMPFWMDNYFLRGNYLIIDNKPVVFVYSQDRLAKDCFKSAESQKATFDACREYARSRGFDGMVFAVMDTSLDEKNYLDAIARGYDFRFGYNSGYKAPYDFYEDEDDIVRSQCELFKKQLVRDPERFIATPSCFCDPTPRFSERWNAQGYAFREWMNIWYLQPESFRKLIRGMKEICDVLPENAWARKIMMIDNWNEWDEGHFIAPSHKFGFGYLQAIREELTERDNLPDYRTPADQGFGGYNRSWPTPDFKEICEQRLAQKK